MDFPNKSHRLPARLPQRSKELAEFCGILLGDGCISKYQVHITLHKAEEGDYGFYVRDLIHNLFGIVPGIYYRKDKQALDIVISRIEIAEFLVLHCGLVQGHKIRNRAGIPNWILEDSGFRVACMRGLFDTDGSVFVHSYMSKGMRYAYKKLGFTSACPSLLDSVHALLSLEGIRSRFGSRKDIRIESKGSVQKYFETIGTHNSKHLKRYET